MLICGLNAEILMFSKLQQILIKQSLTAKNSCNCHHSITECHMIFILIKKFIDYSFIDYTL